VDGRLREITHNSFVALATEAWLWIANGTTPSRTRAEANLATSPALSPKKELTRLKA
jgi:hypothetical protein